MKTIKINLYSFDELSPEVQEKVISNFDMLDYDWWESTFEDAKNIGLEIKEFDLDRNRHCKGDFIWSHYEVACKIIENHGPDCETYKTAKEFLRSYEEIQERLDKNLAAIDRDCVEAGEIEVAAQNDFELHAEDLEEEFKNSLLEDYAMMLQNEAEYLSSREAIIEHIKINEYTFEENGKMRNE